MTDSFVASHPAPAGSDANGVAAGFSLVPEVPAPVNGADPVGGAPEGAEALVERVHRLLTDHLNIDAPTPDTDIVDSGALDSFTMVELLATVEEQFGVEVPIETLDVDSFRTARSVADLIATQRVG